MWAFIFLMCASMAMSVATILVIEPWGFTAAAILFGAAVLLWLLGVLAAAV